MAAKGAKNQPKPAKFPIAYGAYLADIAKRADLDWHKLGELANLGYQAVYRNLSGKPERSLLAAAAIRDVLVARGFDVAPVPVGGDSWSPPTDQPAGRPALSEAAELFRHNLVSFREQAGYADLHEGSRATGIPFETLRAYELGSQEVSAAHLLELARVYGRNPLHFEMASPPPSERPPQDVHFRVVAPLEEMSPENRARVEALQREVMELKKSLIEDARQRAEPKPTKRKRS